MSNPLFSSFTLGTLTLASRVVMAPMTRSRAIGHVPNDLMAEYYAQRASAGLIISEGVAPSADGLGYSRTPGIYSQEQIDGWRKTTDAVHASGGRIFAQLMHVGRISHPLNTPAGARVLAPSAVKAEGAMWTDSQAMQPLPEPEALTEAEVEATIADFAQAARNAIEAGFDGVELHGANGYLIEQFINPSANQRTDKRGGSSAARASFAVDAVRAAAAAVGADRVAIRLSPYNLYNGMSVFDDVADTYAAVARGVNGHAVYVHIVRNPNPLFGAAFAAIRDQYKGAIMLNGGYDATSAAADIESGTADLISFGRPFIGNPDLPHRLQTGAALAGNDPNTHYAATAVGYTDYPALEG